MYIEIMEKKTKHGQYVKDTKELPTFVAESVREILKELPTYMGSGQSLSKHSLEYRAVVRIHFPPDLYPNVPSRHKRYFRPMYIEVQQYKRKDRSDLNRGHVKQRYLTVTYGSGNDSDETRVHSEVFKFCIDIIMFYHNLGAFNVG